LLEVFLYTKYRLLQPQHIEHQNIGHICYVTMKQWKRHSNTEDRLSIIYMRIVCEKETTEMLAVSRTLPQIKQERHCKKLLVQLRGI